MPSLILESGLLGGGTTPFAVAPLVAELFSSWFDVWLEQAATPNANPPTKMQSTRRSIR